MRRLLSSAMAAALASVAPASAGIGVDASVGTTGLSGHVHVNAFPFVTLRGGVNYLDFELEDIEYDGIEYDTDFDFTQYGLYADLHPIPLLSSFTITGGYVFGDRQLHLNSTPLEPVEIGDMTFQPDQIGTLEGSADLGNDGIYAGIGWDGTTRGLIPVGIVIRAGVIIGDAPEFSLRAVGGLAEQDPMLQQILNEELAREVENLNEDAQDFRYFPVLSIGIGIGF